MKQRTMLRALSITSSLYVVLRCITAVHSFPHDIYDDEFESLKAFIISHGGRVSDDIERSTGPNPDNKLRGLYAKVPMKAGDEFLRAPFSALILGDNHCLAVRALADELLQGEDAPHYPYIKSQSGHDLLMPNLWSTQEQQLLSGIAPHDPNRHSKYFDYHCANREETGFMTLDDPVIKRAFFIVVARTSTCVGKVCLVPIYDMANHVHEELLNTKWQIEVSGDNATAVMYSLKHFIFSQTFFGSVVVAIVMLAFSQLNLLLHFFFRRKVSPTQARNAIVLKFLRFKKCSRSLRHDIEAGTQIHSFYATNTPGMLREYGYFFLFNFQVDVNSFLCFQDKLKIYITVLK